MSFDFTRAQKSAIENRGGALLVSAAAGSGKTRVLTERLLRYVTEGEDVDRFLVITFTRAAAAELRCRVMESLARAAAARPGDVRLRRQQTLCCRAHIGTIHSFCTEVVRENCHRLGLPPSFSVLEEDRAEQIKRSVLSRLLEDRYETIAEDAAFRSLVDTVGAGRDDKRLESTVLALYERLRAYPDMADRAARQKAALEAAGVGDAGETVWGAELLAEARVRAAEQTASMEAARAELGAAGGAILKAYGPSFDATLEALREFQRGLERGWDAAAARADIPFPRLGPLRGFEDEALKDRVTAARKRCRDAADGWKETFAQSSEAVIAELRSTAPAMGALLDLTLALEKAFSREKLRRGGLDFSDLEQYAARLLVSAGPDGDFVPTVLAAEYRGRFREIMVDEYQDVSPVQELIFRAVSDHEKNLFLVGDVKQSIYRFRCAEPALFLEKYRAWPDADGLPPESGKPRRILLRENFRSRAAVLRAANGVFSNIMSERLGELDYDADAALVPGAAHYPAGTDEPAELVLVEPETGDGGARPPEKSRREARYVAERIAGMMREGVTVYGADGPRKCRWGDFVILLRSGGGEQFRLALAERGIPVESGGGGGFFTSLEITVAVDLLSLIDNPHADVPLISVLRSPVFGFTPDELGAVRARSPDAGFFRAVRAAAEGGDVKCRDFLDKLGGWRAIAPDLSPDALLWRVCADTDLPAVCAAMADGEERLRRLTALFEYARAFGESGQRDLFRFVGWLRRLAEKDVSTSPAPGAGEDAVRIMSIHKSKGLEFPFVFLCDLHHRFNRRDAQGSVLLHGELGLGPKYTELALGVEWPTIAHRAIAARTARETLSEEMRVLYVAMTRAREKLVMTATKERAEEYLSSLRAEVRSPLPPGLLESAPDRLRWLAGAALLEGTGIELKVAAAGAETEPPVVLEAGAPSCPEEAEAAYGRIREKLSFVYPYDAAAALPSKLTATELKRASETADADAVSLTEARREKEKRTAFRAPRLDGERPLTAAERGSAAHRFLQYLDYGKTGTAGQLEAEAARLAAGGYLSAAEREALDLGAIRKLFASPLGRAMRGAAELRREFRFTLLEAAAKYFPEAPAGDELLLQGVVDCCFIEDGAITVVDFKTDRVTAEEAKTRGERYRGQLRAYAAALRSILGLPVRKTALWFLTPGVEVIIEL